ncbi:hypothetical protein [Thermodesulfitimonas sp.]
MLPLSYHFYRKALEKSFGSRVRFIYQDFNAPGDLPDATDLVEIIRAANLPLPVVVLGREVFMAGSLPGVAELVREVKKRLPEE